MAVFQQSVHVLSVFFFFMAEAHGGFWSLSFDRSLLFPREKREGCPESRKEDTRMRIRTPYHPNLVFYRSFAYPISDQDQFIYNRVYIYLYLGHGEEEWMYAWLESYSATVDKERSTIADVDSVTAAFCSLFLYQNKNVKRELSSPTHRSLARHGASTVSP